jgi:site-specific recombinase XerD
MEIDRYKSELQRQRLSPRTIDAYVAEAVRFRDYMKSNRLRISGVKPSTILNYLEYLASIGHQGTDAQRSRLAALQRYFDFICLTTDGRIDIDISRVPRPKRGAPKVDPVDDSSAELLLEGVTDPRDRAIVATLFSTGLRISELVSLDIDSISIEEEPGAKHRLGVGRVIGKGNKERIFLVDEAALKTIEEYAAFRGRPDLRPLFLSNRGCRISVRAVQHLLKAWSKKLGLPHVHPHALRHTAATTWKRLGVPLAEISRLLGHASVATTEIYVAPDLAQLRAEYFAAMEMLNGARYAGDQIATPNTSTAVNGSKQTRPNLLGTHSTR